MEREKGKRFSKHTKQIIREAQHHKCYLCGEEHHPLDVHHCVPRCRAGGNNIENGVGLCKPCHHACDTLTIKYGVPFRQIMQQGVEYVVSLYPKSPADSITKKLQSH